MMIIIGLGKTAQVCNHFCALSSDHCERFSFREASAGRNNSRKSSASFLVVSGIMDNFLPFNATLMITYHMIYIGMSCDSAASLAERVSLLESRHACCDSSLH